MYFLCLSIDKEIVAGTNRNNGFNQGCFSLISSVSVCVCNLYMTVSLCVCVCVRISLHSHQFLNRKENV